LCDVASLDRHRIVTEFDALMPAQKKALLTIQDSSWTCYIKNALADGSVYDPRPKVHRKNDSLTMTRATQNANANDSQFRDTTRVLTMAVTATPPKSTNETFTIDVMPEWQL